MFVYRLCKPKFSALDGEGAKLYGGRWNFAGHPVVYTSSQLSLAVLELLVHTDVDLIPDDLISLKIDIPEEVSRETINFPPNWEKSRDENLLKQHGSQWLIEQRSAIAVVPSVIVPTESNILLNPLHSHAQKIQIVESTPFTFDPRLMPHAKHQTHT